MAPPNTDARMSCRHGIVPWKPLKVFFQHASFWAAMVAVAGCRSQEPSPVSTGPVPNVKLYKVQMQHYRNNVQVARGKTNTVSYFHEGSVLEAEKGRFFVPQTAKGGAGAKKEVELAAPLFRALLENNQVQAEQGLWVKTPAHVQFFARTGVYDPRSQTVEGKEGVRVQTSRYELSSKSCRFDLRAENYLFEHSVQSRMEGEW